MSYVLDEEGWVLFNLYFFCYVLKIFLSLELLVEGIEIIEVRDNYFKVVVCLEIILELVVIFFVFYLECIFVVFKYEGVVGR